MIKAQNCPAFFYCLCTLLADVALRSVGRCVSDWFEQRGLARLMAAKASWGKAIAANVECYALLPPFLTLKVFVFKPCGRAFLP